jgi:hypothetical protein
MTLLTPGSPSWFPPDHQPRVRFHSAKAVITLIMPTVGAITYRPPHE